MMRKLFILMGVVALSFAAVSCNSEKKAQKSNPFIPESVQKVKVERYKVANDAELDSMSYALGSSLGLQMRFGMADLELDNELMMKFILDTFEKGEIDQETIAKDQQRAMEFQSNRFYPRMMASYQGTPEEELPAFFNEEFTKEEFTGLNGRAMAATLLDLKDVIDINWVVTGMQDAIAVESEDTIFDNLRLTEEQMMPVFTQLSTLMQQREMERAQRIAEENAAASAEWLAEIEQMEGVQKTESGLLYRIDREGSDVKATRDEDSVEVNYEGKLRTGKVFDSSYERGESISFPLNGVIKGWTEGMKLVGEGGQITLWIPANMAYGVRGAGADIGPNEALEFKVELIKVNPEN